jgi:hypothetical protein
VINSTGLKVWIIASRQIPCIFGYVSCFRKIDKNPIELEINENRLTQPREVAEA